MSRTITYAKLISCLNQRVPVYDFLNPSNDVSAIFSDEVQHELIPHLLTLTKINPYYVKTFLKKYIQTIELANNEVAEEIYELYCDQGILNAVEKPPTEMDAILYPVGGFRSDQEPKNGLVVIEETPKIISGNGTTGLRTWEAALYLANFLNSNNVDLANKRICELGTGTGLVGLALAKYYHQEVSPIKKIIFTDGDASLIDTLATTLQINGLAVDDTILTQQLLWGTTNPDQDDFMLRPPAADCLIAADVTYDSSILPLLCSTINDFFTNGTKLALIAATVRNTDTISDWEKELQIWFGGNYSIIEKTENPALIDSICWFKSNTPEIRIYKITPA